MNRKPKVALYCRVSLVTQDTTGQENELRDYARNRGLEIVKVYRDKISGTRSSRPELDELMADARKGKFSTVVVWKFDRFARSVSHLLHALESFQSWGIGFVSISEAISLDTAAGKMVFTVLGAVAELERSLIAERVRMGLQNARRQGKTLGRPAIKKLSTQEIERIRLERKKGATLRQLSKKLGASLWSVHQASLGGAS